MKDVLYTILLLMSSAYCKAQYYDSAKAVAFVNQLLQHDYYTNPPNNRIYYLVDKPNYLYYQQSEIKNVYKDLAPYLTIEQIDSAVVLSKVLAQNTIWGDNSINIPVITQDSASTIIQDNCTLLVVLKKNTKREKRKAAAQAQKAKDLEPKRYVLNISVPIFFNNDRCIIFKSYTYGNTIGGHCIELYQLGDDGVWKNIVNTACKLS